MDKCGFSDAMLSGNYDQPAFACQFVESGKFASKQW